jgi:Uma2 family endonuclease
VAEPAKRKATYADLEAVPPHLVAEIIHGALVTHPRPSPPHVVAAILLSTELTFNKQRGKRGPGSWVFMQEPELHLGENVVVPDIAGWRSERMPTVPKTSRTMVAPDWICEVLSPSTHLYDKGAKRNIYGDAGIPVLWLLDPRETLLEVFQLAAGKWLLWRAFAGDVEVRAVPFEDIPFPLGQLWPSDQPDPS